MARKRALEAIRVSRYRAQQKDAQNTVSPDVQKRLVHNYREDQGWEFAGRAEDLDISAFKVGPFERPDLGQWLNFRVNEFDVIIWPRLDRAIRNMADMANLAAWAKTHQKTLVFVKGPGGAPLVLDLAADALAEFIVMIYAWAAQAEAQADSERVTETNIFMRMVGRYRGGWTPMGYRPTTNPRGHGYILEHDPEHIDYVKTMVNMARNLKGPSAIADWLNAKGVLTSRDIMRKRRGQPIKGLKWNHTLVLSVLRSRALCGLTEYKGDIVYGDDAEPLRFGPPIIDDDEWAKLQTALDQMSRPKNRQRNDSPWQVGVSVCGICGKPLHTRRQRNRKENNKVYVYMVCSGVREGTCNSRLIRMDSLEEEIENRVNEAPWAQTPYLAPHTKAGHNNAPEIATLRMTLRDVAGKREEAEVMGQPDVEKEYRERGRIIKAKLKKLIELPEQQPDIITWEPTGQTKAQHWASLNGEGKHGMLRAHNAKVRAAMTDTGLVVTIDPGRLEAAREWVELRNR